MLRSGRPPRLVKPPTRNYFLSCAGLSALLAAERRARRGGGWLRLTGADKGVTCRVLELTGTHTMLRAESSSITSSPHGRYDLADRAQA